MNILIDAHGISRTTISPFYFTSNGIVLLFVLLFCNSLLKKAAKLAYVNRFSIIDICFERTIGIVDTIFFVQNFTYGGHGEVVRPVERVGRVFSNVGPNSVQHALQLYGNYVPGRFLRAQCQYLWSMHDTIKVR